MNQISIYNMSPELVGEISNYLNKREKINFIQTGKYFYDHINGDHPNPRIWELNELIKKYFNNGYLESRSLENVKNTISTSLYIGSLFVTQSLDVGTVSSTILIASFIGSIILTKKSKKFSNQYKLNKNFLRLSSFIPHCALTFSLGGFPYFVGLIISEGSESIESKKNMFIGASLTYAANIFPSFSLALLHGSISSIAEYHIERIDQWVDHPITQKVTGCIMGTFSAMKGAFYWTKDIGFPKISRFASEYFFED